MKRFLVQPPKEVGELYSSVAISPAAVARQASSARVLQKVIELTSQLEKDPYTSYMLQFYERGLQLASNDWGFMDIVSVLYAVAEMGQPENYLEIGVRRGRSVCAVAAASPRTNVFAFDIWAKDYGNNANPGPALVETELAKFGYQGQIKFIDGDSHSTVPGLLQADPSLKFDLITVDGDHSVSGAWDDLKNVTPRLRVGGVLVFDDIANRYCPGLDAVWQDLLRADSGLAGYSYSDLGAGIAFAVRVREASFCNSRKWKMWGR